jgi:RNA recognition motif-containing protein
MKVWSASPLRPHAAVAIDAASAMGRALDLGMLRRHFEQFGPVEEALVPQDPVTKSSRGFAFINFANNDDRERALAHPEHVIDGRRVRRSHTHMHTQAQTKPAAFVYKGTHTHMHTLTHTGRETQR